MAGTATSMKMDSVEVRLSICSPISAAISCRYLCTAGSLNCPEMCQKNLDILREHKRHTFVFN